MSRFGVSWFLVLHEGKRHGHIRLVGPFSSRKTATAAGYTWYDSVPKTRAHEVLMEVLQAGSPRTLLPVSGMIEENAYEKFQEEAGRGLTGAAKSLAMMRARAEWNRRNPSRSKTRARRLP